MNILHHAKPKSSAQGHRVQLINAGFTLVELMIAIVLGLLLVAAATQLFVGGLINVKLQQAGGDIQDNGVFGLEFLSREIRLSNYGNANNLLLTDTTPLGGIVLSADVGSASNTNLPFVRNSNSASDYIAATYLSRGAGDTAGTAPQWTGATNITGTDALNVAVTQSDQLTIQYQAPAAMTDCEGGAVNAGDTVVERYFLRLDTAATPAATAPMQNLSLVCNAGNIQAASISASGTKATPTASNPSATTTTYAILTSSGSASTATYGGAGQVIMTRVDHLHFLLGTQIQGTTNMAYYTIPQYRALASKPRIMSVQMAALVRSIDNSSNAVVDPTKSFQLFDQTVTPKATANTNANRYVRRVYMTTIALRNTLGGAS